MDTFEGKAHASKLHTKSPIVEELRVIGAHDTEAPVILINGLRFFHVKPQTFQARATRQYPSLIEVLEVLESFPIPYTFVTFGDVALIVPSRSDITYSDTLAACTASQLWSHMPESADVDNAELYLLRGGSEQERATLKTLPLTLDLRPEQKTGGHYWFWRALVLFGDGDLQGCIESLSVAEECGFPSHRIVRFVKGITG